MEQNKLVWYWILLFLVIFFLVGMSVMVFNQSSLDGVDHTREPSFKEKWASITRHPMQFFQSKKRDIEDASEVVARTNVLSYGAKDGVEEQLVRGVILRWGETYVEVETAERMNYPLLLPEKTLWVRCLPETVTMSSGKERATRNVYVDMMRDAYKGVLMSAYNAPNVLPIGSEVLVLVKKDMQTNEVYPVVMAGYGCENGSTDPLEK